MLLFSRSNNRLLIERKSAVIHSDYHTFDLAVKTFLDGFIDE